jgi:hypothetical protein
MEVIAAFMNGKAFLWYHPESDSHYIDYNSDATDGLSEIVAEIELVEGKHMRVHFPELYEAHIGRDREFLTRMATDYGLTYEEFEASNWDNEGKLDMSEPEIKTGFEVPAAEAPAPRKRGRPKGAATKSSQAEALQAALAFVAPVQDDISDFSQYVNLTNNIAIASSTRLAAGHPIAEELHVCPQIEKLQAALARCGKTLVITETEGGQLAIKGDKLRAIVPCNEGIMPDAQPDPPVMQGDFDVLKKAFKVCGTLASENGERVIEASLLLDPNVCTGTNGQAMLQFWHGLNVPPGTVIPKVFAKAVAECSKKIIGIGGNWDNEAGFLRSFTVWFDGGAWLKTQCYTDRWPSIDTILNVVVTPTDTPVGLFDAIEAVTHFIDEAKSRRIYLTDGYVQSHLDTNIGAQYEVAGLPGGKIFDGKLVKQVAPWAKKIDLTTVPDRAFFFGEHEGSNVRGVIMAMMGG